MSEECAHISAESSTGSHKAAINVLVRLPSDQRFDWKKIFF